MKKLFFILSCIVIMGIVHLSPALAQPSFTHWLKDLWKKSESPPQTQSIQNQQALSPTDKIKAPSVGLNVSQAPSDNFLNATSKLEPYRDPRLSALQVIPYQDEQAVLNELKRRMEDWLRNGIKQEWLSPPTDGLAWKSFVSKVYNDELQHIAFIPAESVWEVPECNAPLYLGRLIIDTIESVNSKKAGDFAKYQDAFLGKITCLAPETVRDLENFFSRLVDEALKSNLAEDQKKILLQGVLNMGMNLFDLLQYTGYSIWQGTLKNNMSDLRKLLTDYSLGFWFYDFKSGRMDFYNLTDLKDLLAAMEDVRNLGNGTCELTDMVAMGFKCFNGITCGEAATAKEAFGSGKQSGTNFGGLLSPNSSDSGAGASTLRFGIPMGEAESLLSGLSECSSGGSGGKRAGGGNGNDGGGGQGGYNAQASCLSSAIKSSGNLARSLQCASLAVSKPSWQPKTLAGEQTVTAVQGIRDRLCALGDEGGDSNKGSEPKKAPDEKAAAQQKELEDAANKVKAEAKKAAEQLRDCMASGFGSGCALKGTWDDPAQKHMTESQLKEKAALFETVANMSTDEIMKSIAPLDQGTGIFSNLRIESICKGASACRTTNADGKMQIHLTTGKNGWKTKEGSTTTDKNRIIQHEVAHVMLGLAGTTNLAAALEIKKEEIDHTLMGTITALTGHMGVFRPSPIDEGRSSCEGTAVAAKMNAAMSCMAATNGYQQGGVPMGPNTPFVNPNPLNDHGGLPSNEILSCVFQGGSQVRHGLNDKRCMVERCAPETGNCSCDGIDSRYGGGGSRYNNPLVGAKDPLRPEAAISLVQASPLALRFKQVQENLSTAFTNVIKAIGFTPSVRSEAGKK